MKKLFTKLILVSFLGTFLVIGFGTLSNSTNFIIGPVQASDVQVPTITKPDLLPGPEDDPSDSEDHERFQEYVRTTAIPTFIEGFLGLIAGFALLALIYAGIRFLTSYGEEEGITEAKRIATWSIIGFVITLLAYSVVSAINTLAFPEGSYETDSQEQVTYEDI
ncbi:hypothetical protein HN748_02885 [Candidatus Peregrinibacteria bacterium]|jgi:amino acid transporter|nr:hypothetical protein [Candidatus Peregrinibacteria bacterium]MBT7483391.1 hypothetical protein [Candidatus Peregrinibacteria bacterium]MBT7703152.1 hypothetical protein [Candidatus Peregrinibacteria bacterium]